MDHAQLMASAVLKDADDRPDRKNGISSSSIRCVYDGTRTIAVGSERNAKTQIAALLDLLDLHVNGSTSDQDAVTLLLGGRLGLKREAVDAVRTLVGAKRGGPEVRLLEHDADGGWVPIADEPFDAADVTEYTRWPALLSAIPHEPPALVIDLLRRASVPALRAYPMLSSKGTRWSLRVEGLEVGRVTAKGGYLDVGKEGKLGGQSAARISWLSHEDRSARVSFGTDDADLARAAATIKHFASGWTPADPALAPEQNEHALESRILRGAVPVAADGRELELIREHGTVNWGSQFPTKWGRDGSARYLDALLRDGSTPWAIEMKVQGAGGVGQYYRHAIAQAVLYREFIRGATPLHPWFEAYGLDPNACQAAVVVPEIQHGPWLARLKRLCDLFDVPLVQVPHETAFLRGFV